MTVLSVVVAAVAPKASAATAYRLHWHRYTPAGAGGEVGSDGPYLIISSPDSTTQRVVDTRSGTSFHFDSTPPGQGQNRCNAAEGDGRVLDFCEPEGDPLANPGPITLWLFSFSTRQWTQIPADAPNLTPQETAFGEQEVELDAVGSVWAEFSSGVEAPGGGVGFDFYVNLQTGAEDDDSPSEPTVTNLDQPRTPYEKLCTPLDINDFIQWITPHTALMSRGYNVQVAPTDGPLYVQSCGSRTRQTVSQYYDASQVLGTLALTVGKGDDAGLSHVPVRAYDVRTRRTFTLTAPPDGAEGLAIAGGRIYASDGGAASKAPVYVATLPASLRGATEVTTSFRTAVSTPVDGGRAAGGGERSPWRLLSLRAPQAPVLSDERYVVLPQSGSRLAVLIDTITHQTFSVLSPAHGCDLPVIGSGRILTTCAPVGPGAHWTAWIFRIASRRWQTIPGDFDAVADSQQGIGSHWAEFELTDTPSFYDVSTGRKLAHPPTDDGQPQLDASGTPFPAICPPLARRDFVTWLTSGLALMYGDAGLYTERCGTGVRHVLGHDTFFPVYGGSWVVWSAQKTPVGAYDFRTGRTLTLKPPPGAGEFDPQGLVVADGQVYSTDDGDRHQLDRVWVATLGGR